MIPGDIDLTENLDFRNVKKRNTPQLPASWRGNNNGMINVSNDAIYTITSRRMNISWSYYYNDYAQEYADNMIINGIREVRNDTDLSWNLTTTFNPHNQDYLDSTIYFWNDYGESDYHTISNITSSSSSSLNVRFINDPKYDVFGNHIKEPKQIPKIPWKNGYNKYDPSIRKIAWQYSGWTRFDNDYIPDIPWETEASILWRKLRPMNLSDYINKAKNLIAWFNKKSSSFIEKYFEDIEEVDTSYLTNMGWIRIHDAIID